MASSLSKSFRSCLASILHGQPLGGPGRRPCSLENSHASTEIFEGAILGSFLFAANWLWMSSIALGCDFTTFYSASAPKQHSSS
ncbi:hypothetical protein O181_067348 [Austropuccinia psidii MF-1]|uniref:Uncharacterized protein n=1 Tax=Austropuccinia psidii MF-1 TaxID=1389203 RepID=A0A9Q3I4F5_9BASI|nr:hypothetical protein [Austropuccinia psidii MF-1]